MFYSVRRFRELIDIARRKERILTAGPDDGRIVRNARLTVFAQATVTIVLGYVGIAIVLNPEYDEGTKKAACGWLGTIIGYWLR